MAVVEVVDVAVAVQPTAVAVGLVVIVEVAEQRWRLSLAVLVYSR